MSNSRTFLKGGQSKRRRLWVPLCVAQPQGEEDEVIFAAIDMTLGDNFRNHVFNFAKHCRPAHCGLILERTGVGPPLAAKD